MKIKYENGHYAVYEDGEWLFNSDNEMEAKLDYEDFKSNSNWYYE